MLPVRRVFEWLVVFSDCFLPVARSSPTLIIYAVHVSEALHRVSQLLKLARPMMRAAARFHPNQARRKVHKE
jgi:hypothetical protein